MWEMVETMTAGLHQWRPDLNYPDSYSDWHACLVPLMQMYDIKRRPIALKIEDIEEE